MNIKKYKQIAYAERFVYKESSGNKNKILQSCYPFGEVLLTLFEDKQEGNMKELFSLQLKLTNSITFGEVLVIHFKLYLKIFHVDKKKEM